MIALAPVLVFLRGVPRWLSWRGWVAVAVLVAFAATGAYCAQRGAQGEKDRQAVERAGVEARASSARETAASERFTDQTSTQTRLDERNHDAQALPDGVPDVRERSRRCRQLREAGIVVPECG